MLWVYLCAVKLKELNKIKVGIVNYLNTRPLIYGIERSAVANEMELIGDYPSKIAALLIKGEIDMGLVPVAIIPKLPSWHINTGYGIACDGEVASVCIFSDVPLEEATAVLLDYQSRTSVQLARILLKEFYKVDPVLESAGSEFQHRIKGNVAGLIIGDRALRQRKSSKYIYDLGEAWKSHTGLPFIFAAWISVHPIDPLFIEKFHQANKMGMDHIEEIVRDIDFPEYDLQHYYNNNISYELDDQKLKGLQLFLEKLGAVTV